MGLKSVNGPSMAKTTHAHPFATSPAKPTHLPPFGPHGGKYYANATLMLGNANLTTPSANGTHTGLHKYGILSLIPQPARYTFGPMDESASTNEPDGAKNSIVIYVPTPPTPSHLAASPSLVHSKAARSSLLASACSPTPLMPPQNTSSKCAS